MSGIHIARQGFITKAAISSQARQRGPVAFACSLLLNGNGADGAQNTLVPSDLTGSYSFSRALTPVPVNFSPYTSGGSIYQTGTARQAYFANPVPIPAGEFCIELWCYPENFSAARELISNRAWQFGNNKGWQLTIANNGTVMLGASQSVWNSFPAILTSTTALTANAWNHVAFTRDSSDVLRVFINGVLSTSMTYTQSLDQSAGGFGTHYFTLGNSYYDGQFSTQPFNGYIGDVRVNTGVGSATYTANFTPPTSTLIPTTGTLVAVRSTGFVLESSGNNVPVIPFGSVAQSIDSPFGTSYPGSLLFSSNASYLSAPTNPGFSFSGAFTVEGWFNWSTLPSAGQITGVLAAGGFNITYSTTLQFNLYGTGSIASAAFTPVLGRWYHIAMTRNEVNLCTIWIDGVSSATGTSSTSFAQGAWSLYGGSNNGGAGNVTNLRVVKGTAVYTTNFTPSTTPLTAISGTSLLLLGSNIGIIDTSANKYNVSVFGNTKISTTQSKFGGSSIQFDGTNDYLTVANATPLLFTVPMFHVECWVYRSTSGAFHSIVGKGNSTNGWLLQINSTDKLTFLVGAGIVMTSTTSINTGTWTHIAVTRDGTNMMRMFVNGVLEASVSNNTSFSQSEVLTIGADRSNNNSFNGFIEDLRIFRDSAKYISAFTTPVAELQATDDVYRYLTNTVYGVYQLA